MFEREVAGSGWYEFFDQVNLSGSVLEYRAALSLQANCKLAP